MISTAFTPRTRNRKKCLSTELFLPEKTILHVDMDAVANLQPNRHKKTAPKLRDGFQGFENIRLRTAIETAVSDDQQSAETDHHHASRFGDCFNAQSVNCRNFPKSHRQRYGKSYASR